MATLSAARTQAYIVASKRTAFGAFGGKWVAYWPSLFNSLIFFWYRLKDLKASELGALASKAALATLPKEIQVDSVIFG